MKKDRILPSFSDQRGHIFDIVYADPVDHVGLVTFTSGSIRGNHYHRETTQINFVLSGKIEYCSTFVSGGFLQTTMLDVNDMIVSRPMEIHAFRAMEDSSMMVLSRGPRGGVDYESDTWRVASLFSPSFPTSE